MSTTLNEKVQKKFESYIVQTEHGEKVPFNSYYNVSNQGTVFAYNPYVRIYVSMSEEFFKANNEEVPPEWIDELYDIVYKYVHNQIK